MKRWIPPLTFRHSRVKVTVKLYGTLGRRFDDYDHTSGLGVCLDHGATIRELFIHLRLDPKRVGMVFMDGLAVNMETPVKAGARIKIFQPIFGG